MVWFPWLVVECVACIVWAPGHSGWWWGSRHSSHVHSSVPPEQPYNVHVTQGWVNHFAKQATYPIIHCTTKQVGEGGGLLTHISYIVQRLSQLPVSISSHIHDWLVMFAAKVIFLTIMHGHNQNTLVDAAPTKLMPSSWLSSTLHYKSLPVTNLCLLWSVYVRRI